MGAGDSIEGDFLALAELVGGLIQDNFELANTRSVQVIDEQKEQPGPCPCPCPNPNPNPEGYVVPGTAVRISSEEAGERAGGAQCAQDPQSCETAKTTGIKTTDTAQTETTRTKNARAETTRVETAGTETAVTTTTTTHNGAPDADGE
ncbi:unnamed protein product, partial [Discosporangium mesarthrocarpum]